jgi:hypothetical protein
MQETFFRPDEISRKSKVLAASIFNAYRLLLSRSDGNCVFVPMRSIQFQSVATANEVIFIDSYGAYHSHGESAGRCISYAWQFSAPLNRDSLTQSVNYEWVCYCQNSVSMDSRLPAEYHREVEYHLSKFSRETDQNFNLNIIPLKQ